MKSIFNGHGYTFNDDRASGGRLVESDLLGCKHCQKLLRKEKWKAHGGFCTVCDSPICSECLARVGQHGCENYAREVERAVKADYQKQQNARILGI